MRTATLTLLTTLLLGSATWAADIPVKANVKTTAYTDLFHGPYGFLQVGVGQTKGRAETEGGSDRYQVEKCYTPKYEVWEGGDYEKCYPKRNTYVNIPYSAGGGEDNVIGLLVGAGAGYNWRTGTNMALGVEADGVYSFMNGYINLPGGTIRHQVPYLLSLTGRVIFIPTSMPNTGIYAKAGGVLVGQRTSINGATTSADKAGWTVGGGVEKQLPALGLSTRLEYMYARVSDQVVPFSGGVSTLSGSNHAVKAILSKPF